MLKLSKKQITTPSYDSKRFYIIIYGYFPLDFLPFLLEIE